MLARVVQGAAAATWTAALALVAQTYTQRRTAMMGLAMLGGNAGSVWAPRRRPAAGVGQRPPGGWPRAALLLIDLLLRFLALLVEPPRPAGERRTCWACSATRRCWWRAGVVVVGVGGWGLLEPLLPNHLARTAAAAPWAIGLMFATATLFYGLATPWVERAVGSRGCGGRWRPG